MILQKRKTGYTRLFCCILCRGRVARSVAGLPVEMTFSYVYATIKLSP